LAAVRSCGVTTLAVSLAAAPRRDGDLRLVWEHCQGVPAGASTLLSRDSFCPASGPEGALPSDSENCMQDGRPRRPANGTNSRAPNSASTRPRITTATYCLGVRSRAGELGHIHWVHKTQWTTASRGPVPAQGLCRLRHQARPDHRRVGGRARRRLRHRGTGLRWLAPEPAQAPPSVCLPGWWRLPAGGSSSGPASRPTGPRTQRAGWSRRSPGQRGLPGSRVRLGCGRYSRRRRPQARSAQLMRRGSEAMICFRLRNSASG